MVFRNNIFNPIYDSGDKISQDINHKCGKKHWPCPDKFYKSLMKLEIIYLTLFMKVGVK